MQVWINQGDIVLLSLRDFQDDKADVIVKYTSDEARNCMSCNDLAPSMDAINTVSIFSESIRRTSRER